MYILCILYIYIYIHTHTHVLFGKLKLSCDVIVVSHFSHQVMVFE